MQKNLSVKQLNNYIKGVFDDELILHGLSVTGEIYELKSTPSNTYITLKDEDFLLNCISFSAIPSCKAGQRVTVRGTVRYYAKGGRLSFIVDSVKAIGGGEIKARLDEVKSRLEKDGVFTNARPLKAMTMSVALITSSEGAVLHDFMSVLGRGAPYINVTVFDVRVQGEGSAEAVTAAIKDAEAAQNNVIVIARGGGSAADLSGFNDEQLARRVHSCAVPVISAVGHETDYTLCDFAADMRAGTPSIAAEMIVGGNRRFLSAFFNRAWLNSNLAASLVKRAERNVRRCAFRTAEAQRLLSHKEAEIRSLAERNAFSLTALISKKETALKVAAAGADARSPLKLLAAGYARVARDGEAVKDAGQVKSGDSLTIVMNGGQIDAQAVAVRAKGDA